MIYFFFFFYFQVLKGRKNYFPHLGKKKKKPNCRGRYLIVAYNLNAIARMAKNQRRKKTVGLLLLSFNEKLKVLLKERLSYPYLHFHMNRTV